MRIVNFQQMKRNGGKFLKHLRNVSNDNNCNPLRYSKEEQERVSAKINQALGLE